MNVLSKAGTFLVLSVCFLIFGTTTSASAAPKLLSPIAGSTLPGSTATFTWTANGESLTDWSLRIGTKQGDSSLYNSGNLPSGTLAQTAVGIPTNGSTVWVRLQWRYTNGLWSSTDVQYTANTGSGSTSSTSSTSTVSTASASTTSNNGSGRPALLTPSAGSTLPGSTATFTWTANGAALTDWSLRVGLSAGDSDVYNSGNLPSGTLARTVSGLPTNGLPVWVRLQWRYTDGSWSSTDVQYKSGTGSTSTSDPTPTSPSPTNTSTSTTPSGSAFYVSTSGNDANPGTQSAPFRTIKRGLGVLQPGNTLFIRGGTYQEFLHSWNGTRFPSGNSWSSPITIAAFNGETVNLVGSIDLAQSSPAIQYLIFDGIRINANGEETGISLTGNTHHIRFQNGEVKNAGRWGIATNFHNTTSFADTFYEFINLDVHHNGRTKNVDHGFYIKTSRNLIDGCHIHDNVAWGIHNFAGDNSEPKANNNTYRNNLIHHNGINYSQGGGITMGSGDNNIAYNNVVWKNYTGINVHSYRNPVNSGVFHNTIYGNTGYGILIEPGSQGADVINNISYGNYVNMDNRGSGTSISNNLTSNPSFKNASAGDFHLQSGSAAIDTGTTLSAVPTDREGRRRPQGNRSDIGAYEW
ncbi:MAG: right-handed parallel beta-helix repeat-containing protein [Nitrospiraceae bacterium]|nr:right-handed parallel beta-helix repeat-containing protein [Nitrospiraceae bacterium]